MNLLNGIPKILKSLNDDIDESKLVLFENSLKLVPNADKTFFLVLTIDSIHVYSTRPAVEICRSERRPESLEQFGHNFEAVWRSDSSAIAVVTDQNFLLIFDVTIHQTRPLLQFKYSTVPEYIEQGSGEARGVPNIGIQLACAVQIGRPLSSVVPLKETLLLFTPVPPEWHELSWQGELLPSKSGDLTQLPFLTYSKKAKTECSQYAVKCRAANASKSWFVWQNEQNQLYLVQKVPKADSFVFHGSPFAFPDSQSTPTSAAFAHRISQLAVGDSSGTVYLYKIPESAMHATQLLCKLKVDPLAGSASKPSSVADISYSDDDACIAVAWERSGIALWTAAGALIWSTCGEDVWVQSGSLGTSALDAFFGPTLSVFWGPGGFELFVLPRQRTPQISIFVLPLTKSVLATNPVYSNINSGLLVGDEHVLIPSFTSDIYSVANTSSVHITSVQIPSIYSGLNWPVSLVAIDSTKQYLAVAGKLGVIIWSNASGKWRMFANEVQESSFASRGGMGWFQHWLVMSCEDATGQATVKYTLRAFNRKRALDLGLAAFEVSLPAPVQTLQIEGNRLLCVLSNKLVVGGVLGVASPNGALQLHWKHQIDLSATSNLPQQLKHSIKCVLRLPLLPNDTEETRPSFLVLCGTELGILTAGDANRASTFRTVCNRIDWMCTFSHHSSFDHKETVYTSAWAVGGAKVRVWLNPCTEKRESDDFWTTYITESSAITIAVDTQPSQISLSNGCVFGLEQKLQLRGAFDFAWFKAQHSARLFVPTVVLYLLSLDKLEAAKLYCKQFQHLDYFDHILEVILHEAIEAEDEPGKAPTVDANLSRVCQFLESFPNRLEIIVRCARKSEVAIWPRFFQFVGDIKLLFRECLDFGYLDTACSYLIILQTLETVEISRPLARQLLQIAVKSNYRKVVSQVVRYLQSIGDLSLLNTED